MTFDGKNLPVKQISRLFRKSDPVDAESQDYIFAYEDRNLHARAKEALSFVPYGAYGNEEKHTDDPHFDRPHALDFTPAFEYTEDHLLAPKSDVASHYRTIFTYTESADLGTHLVDDRTTLYRRVGVYSASAFFLRTLSVTFFVLFFPFLCWIFIKRLSEHERLIVFRLGRRLKPKGPGFVFVLPFCDEYHSVRLDEQTLQVSPVSGATSDGSLVEVHFNVIYRLVDLECAFVTAKEAPSRLVATQAQLSILSSLKRLSLKQLNDPGARQELEVDATVNFNCRCSSHGIQLSRINITDIRLLHISSSIEPSKTLKRLRILSSALFPQSTRLTPSPALNLDANSATVADKHTTQLTESMMKSVETDEANLSPTSITADPTTLVERDGPGGSKTSNCFIEDVCKRAIARACPFLNSHLTRIAFGGSTLQLVVSSKQFVLPLPSLTEVQESNCYTLFHLDSKRGVAAMGQLPPEISPHATVYITASTLSDILNGRLNFENAAKNQNVFITGDSAAFNKLQHLLYLHSF